MQILPRSKARKQFQHYWDETHQEWFKIEVLQDYTGEDDSPSLQAWLAGDKTTSINLLRQTTHNGWRTMCREKYKTGVLMRRIRIIQKPYTSYTEWEIEFYKHLNIPSGEQIFILDKNVAEGFELPKGDVMIFDNKRVATCDYDKNGRMISETFYDENDDISNFLQLKNELIEIAQPL